MTKQKLRDKIALYPAELDFGLIKEKRIEKEENYSAKIKITKNNVFITLSIIKTTQL